MVDFPYPYRPGQRGLVGFINRTIRQRGCAVVEAGTGVGKTITSLCGTVGYARDHGMKVLYLTRTKSQQKQVIRESAAIGDGILCVGVQGRSASSCPLMRDDPELSSGTSEEISKLCSEYKRKGDDGCHCPYYSAIESTDIGSWVERVRRDHPEPEDFSKLCEDSGLCPYEMVKYVLPEADVIAVPYPFVFMPQVLDRFIQWLGVPLSKTIIVVDEAHNLPDYLREVQTCECSMRAMELAEKEAGDNGDPEVHDGMTVTDVIAVTKEVLSLAVREYLIDDDGMLPPYFLQEELMSRLGLTSNGLSKVFKAMEEIGDGIAERKKQRRKLPRSYIMSMSRFMQAWVLGDEDLYVRLVVGKDNPKFQSYCLDPSGASGPLNECHASVHMSGTLEPLDAYAIEMGLERPSFLRLEGMFPPENLLKLYSDEVTMNYEERYTEPNYGILRRLIVDSVSAVNVNTAVFFPSYQFMERMVSEGIVDELGRDIYFEEKGMGQSDLMETVENFSMAEGGVLFCITGGRISEGIDFPADSLEMAVVVGVPFPKPTAKLRALHRYYDIRFGDGRRFTSTIPATRKLRQAMGRVIRSETDRGVVVILDRRISSLGGLDSILCRDLPVAVKSFFSNDV